MAEGAEALVLAMGALVATTVALAAPLVTILVVRKTGHPWLMSPVVLSPFAAVVALLLSLWAKLPANECVTNALVTAPLSVGGMTFIFWLKTLRSRESFIALQRMKEDEERARYRAKSLDSL